MKKELHASVAIFTLAAIIMAASSFALQLRLAAEYYGRIETTVFPFLLLPGAFLGSSLLALLYTRQRVIVLLRWVLGVLVFATFIRWSYMVLVTNRLMGPFLELNILTMDQVQSVLQYCVSTGIDPVFQLLGTSPLYSYSSAHVPFIANAVSLSFLSWILGLYNRAALKTSRTTDADERKLPDHSRTQADDMLNRLYRQLMSEEIPAVSPGFRITDSPSSAKKKPVRQQTAVSLPVSSVSEGRPWILVTGPVKTVDVSDWIETVGRISPAGTGSGSMISTETRNMFIGVLELNRLLPENSRRVTALARPVRNSAGEVGVFLYTE